MVSKSDRVKNIIAIAVCAVMLAFVIIRAVTMLITYDEAYTYTECALTMSLTPRGIWELYRTSNSNNHMLNTLLIALIDRLTGIKYVEWVIRIPNILAAMVYLASSCYMYIKRHITAVPFYVLVTAYYVNEFFTFARGYGLAVCFMTLAFYMYILWQEGSYEKDSYPAWILILYALACTANTICLLIAPVFGLVCIYRLIKSGRISGFLKSYWWAAVIAVIVIFAMLLYHIRVSQMIDGVQYAVNESNYFEAFFANFGSMIIDYPVVDEAEGAGIILLIVLNIYFVIVKAKKCPVFTLTFISIALIVLAMGIMGGDGFYTGRVMVPLFVLIPFMRLELDEEIEGRLAIGKYLTMIACAGLVSASLAQMRLDDTREFSSSQETKEAAYEATDLYDYDGFYITVFKYYYDEAQYLRSLEE